MFRQLDLDCIETIFCEKGYLINLFQTPHNYRDTFPECSKISHFFQQFANFRWIHKQWTSAKFWNIFIWTFVDFPLNFTAIRGLQRLIEFCWFSVEIPEHFDLQFLKKKKTLIKNKNKPARSARSSASKLPQFIILGAQREVTATSARCRGIYHAEDVRVRPGELHRSYLGSKYEIQSKWRMRNNAHAVVMLFSRK